VEIKNECLSSYNAAMNAEQNAQEDIFQWKKNQPQYFDDEWISPSWNENENLQQRSVNPNNIMPSFFIS